MPDADLIKTICKGPDAARTRAWMELDHAFRARLFRFLVTLLKNEADVEDCIQEVFLKVLRYACDFRGSFGIWTYLRRLAYTTAMDRLEKLGRIVESGVEPEALEEAQPLDFTELRGDSEAPDHETQRIVDEAFAAFALQYPKPALLLRMHVLEGDSLAEIAEVVGVSENAIKVQMFRARERFRQLLLECLRESA